MRRSRLVRLLSACVGGAALTDVNGVAAVEFALVAPWFGLILAGAIDLGGMLYTKYGLDAAVSAGANYAVVSAASVNSTSGQSLANTIATVVTSSNSSNWANTTIIVNNGPTTSMSETGTPVTGGTAANADSCYCPTLVGSSVSWGSAAPACGGTCPNGSIAGKFVYISASRAYTPFFPSFGIVKNGTITTSAMVQAQ